MGGHCRGNKVHVHLQRRQGGESEEGHRRPAPGEDGPGHHHRILRRASHRRAVRRRYGEARGLSSLGRLLSHTSTGVTGVTVGTNVTRVTVLTVVTDVTVVAVGTVV